MERPEVLGVLPLRYRVLFDAFVGATQDDSRVRALWLGGSIARGDADAASDLDFLVAIADDAFDGITAEWREWIAAITPTAFADAHPFAPGMYFAASDDFARFDITLERAGSVGQTLFPRRVVVFDHDGLHAALPAPGDPPGPSAANVERLVREWFRVTAMPEAVLVRDDWLLATEHAHLLRDLVRQLYLETNAPIPVTGVKHWRSKLTEDQQRVLADLPTSVTSLTDLVAMHVRASTVFLQTARPLAASLGVTWPTELEAAAVRHLQRELAIDDPYPG